MASSLQKYVGQYLGPMSRMEGFMWFYICHARAETFALVVFALGHLLQLALVTTSPILPYALLILYETSQSLCLYGFFRVIR